MVSVGAASSSSEGLLLSGDEPIIDTDYWNAQQKQFINESSNTKAVNLCANIL